MTSLHLIVRLRTLAAATCVVIACTAAAHADEFQELKTKAEKGDMVAQFDLAKRYAAGDGTTKDEKSALDWYLKSASREYVPAYISLGSIYSHGFGVKQDWAESIRWFRKGALAGNRIAQHNLGLDYEHGHGVPQDYKEAAHWFRLGAEQGQPRCQYNLGRLYEVGQGVAASKLDAFVLYTVASAHENQNHIFGEAKAKELANKRDVLGQQLSAAELETAKQRVAAYQADVVVNPRQFGPSDSKIGTSRGWYIWRSYDPITREVEVSPDRPDAGGQTEVFKATMLPWATTYRYLTYGAGPEGLLPGERVNIFFNADERHRRGHLVHFQDEICQMKGHYHYWKIEAPTPTGFTARVFAGDKPTGEPVREFTFDPECRIWAKGAVAKKAAPAAGDHVYLTWCLRNGKNIVKLYSDAESLDAIKTLETERLTKKIAVEGLLGRVESLADDQLHYMIFGDHWLQAQLFKEGTRVRIGGVGQGLKPEGPTAEAVITYRKNRGTYGSGVSDLLLKPAKAEDAPLLRKLQDASVSRIVRVEP